MSNHEATLQGVAQRLRDRTGLNVIVLTAEVLDESTVVQGTPFRHIAAGIGVALGDKPSAEAMVEHLLVHLIGTRVDTSCPCDVCDRRIARYQAALKALREARTNECKAVVARAVVEAGGLQ